MRRRATCTSACARTRRTGRSPTADPTTWTRARAERMAKSVGNIAPLAEVLRAHAREAVVMYLVSGHYRQPLAFSESELEDSERRVQRIREALRALDAASASPPEMGELKVAFF